VTEKNKIRKTVVPVQWPAIIHYENDAELEYVENADQWRQLSRELHSQFEQHDRLIDCTGRVYSVMPANTVERVPQYIDKKISLSAVLGLVKAHLAGQGSCCVAKFYAPSIEAAISMVKPGSECKV